ILTASRKSIHPASNLTVKIDPASGNIQAWAKLEVVEENPNHDQLLLARAQERCPDVKVGEVIDWEVTPRNFGRIAAQTARQAILQQIRKAEKETVQEEFKDQIGEIINGNVRRIEAGNVIVDFQKAEGILSPKDKIPTEQYGPGDRINALLVKVDIETSGPSLILSRSSQAFLRKLFEREVSEIHDGVVEIVAVAREAGSRSKIAVRSNDSRVDPVGACVGMRGMRVRNITNELGGERVDIIHYSDDVEEYVRNVLHPAKLNRIEIDEVKKQLTVYVDAENSRLAFGRKAQNIKLAQRLMQWSINLVTEDPAAEFKAQKANAVSELAGTLSIPEEAAEILVNKGYLTVEDLRADQDNLSAISELDAATVQSIINAL
ncbi:MAG: transcription termination factor NusA, partial [Lentisphaeria bacterium]|nr:transcription termination factor NusA [Lentisphaeria bacterium]